MHRTARISSILALLLISVVAAPVTLAQDADATPSAGHPLVGTWLVDTNAEDSNDPPARVVLGTDGSLVQVQLGRVAVGAWEPTGERTGALTVAAEVADDDGAVTIFIVRASLEASEDGQGWTAEATSEFIGPDGVSSGQLGPIPATATRVAVEPMSPAPSPGA